MIGRYERESMERERAALLEHHGMGELTRAGARRLDELNRNLFHSDMGKKLADKAPSGAAEGDKP